MSAMIDIIKGLGIVKLGKNWKNYRRWFFRTEPVLPIKKKMILIIFSYTGFLGNLFRIGQRAKIP